MAPAINLFDDFHYSILSKRNGALPDGPGYCPATEPSLMVGLPPRGTRGHDEECY